MKHQKSHLAASQRIGPSDRAALVHTWTVLTEHDWHALGGSPAARRLPSALEPLAGALTATDAASARSNELFTRCQAVLHKARRARSPSDAVVELFPHCSPGNNPSKSHLFRISSARGLHVLRTVTGGDS